jgi:signal transduction histidine kinase
MVWPKLTDLWRWQSDIRRTCRSLKFRLVLWNTAVVACVALSILLLVNGGLSIVLERALAQVLQEDAREIGVNLQTEGWNPATYGEELHRKAAVHRQEQWFAELLDESGRRVWSTRGAPAADQVGSSAFRTQEQSLSPSSAGVHRVRVGASYAPLQAQQQTLSRWALFLALLAMVAAPAGGYWLASMATQPFAQAIDTARRLRPGHLQDRLPVRGTEDELDRLSRTVNGLLDRLAVDVRQRQDLLANSAHELRSPLAAIRTTAEVALATPRAAVDYQQALQDVVEQSARLQNLVNQLLLIAEAEADLKNVHREIVDVQRLTQTVVEMMQPLADVRQIDLASRWEPAHVQGNPAHLQALLVNLLDNALKFTPTHGRIAIRLEVDPGCEQVVWEIADTGPGIAESDLPRVGQRFFRGGSAESRRAIPGTGLGLAICRSIAESHGGELKIISKPGEGTRVLVHLPAVDPQTRADYSGSSAGSAGTFT